MYFLTTPETMTTQRMRDAEVGGDAWPLALRVQLSRKTLAILDIPVTGGYVSSDVGLSRCRLGMQPV